MSNFWSNHGSNQSCILQNCECDILTILVGRACLQAVLEIFEFPALFLCKNSTLQFLTGKQLSNSKVHKEYETIFQQLLLWAQMVSNFLAVVVRCSILYYCLGNREGCCLESTLFENDPMSYMTWIFLKNTSTMLFLAISKSPYLRMDLKQCVVLYVHHFTEF